MLLPRLTPDDLRKLLLVDAVVSRVQHEHRQTGGEDPVTTRDFDVAGAAMEKSPEIRQVLRQCDWTGRDYLLTLATTVSAVFRELPDFARQSADWEANVAFVHNLPADLAGPFGEWTLTRLGLSPGAFPE